MTNEQREAIEFFIGKIKDAKPKYTEILVDGKIIKTEIIQIEMRFTQEEAKKMKTVLNMLKEKDTETEKYKALYDRALSDVVKADKQIDLMAERLVQAHEWFYSEFDNFTKEDFIEYFERKVNSSEQN